MECCRLAHVSRCSGSPAQRNSHRPHRWWRGDEVRLATAQFGVRPAVRYQSSELASQRRPILRLPAIVLSSEAPLPVEIIPAKLNTFLGSARTRRGNAVAAALADS